MNLIIPTRDNCQEVRLWRNDCQVSLRTPYGLTTEMQDDFYDNVICNPNNNHRYWSMYNDDKFVGFGGITYIQWENSIGEISLIVNNEYRDKGFGGEAVNLLLDMSFNYLNLKTVFGECYSNNPAKEFWLKISKKYNAVIVTLPNRKFWEGRYHDSIYFSIDRDTFKKLNAGTLIDG